MRVWLVLEAKVSPFQRTASPWPAASNAALMVVESVAAAAGSSGMPWKSKAGPMCTSPVAKSMVP